MAINVVNYVSSVLDKTLAQKANILKYRAKGCGYGGDHFDVETEMTEKQFVNKRFISLVKSKIRNGKQKEIEERIRNESVIEDIIL